LFREIMSITRGAEARLSVAVLGPEGTYSESAALRHFGASVLLRPCATIAEVFRTVETERADFAVVPLENSTEGGVSDTLDKLVTTPLRVAGEIDLKIHHNLLGGAERLESVKRVLAHSQSIAQCKGWLDRMLPQAEYMHVASNAEAARRVSGEPEAAAIAGDAAAEHYDLHKLAVNIEDEPGNTTRFLVMSWRETPPSGRDKTSLLLSCRNRPGALYHLLKPLADHEISMTRIESRPSRSGLWDYIFFVDIEGHQRQSKIAAALAELTQEAGLFKNLGSYPVAV
ncbi:MAG: prephenate dehydratase, partial [Pseudomonadota bacterium]|nr:prephenate dehydratase [Pseudomonadota bacterium]